MINNFFKNKRRLISIFTLLLFGGVLNYFSTYNLLQVQDVNLFDKTPSELVNHEEENTFVKNINFFNIDNPSVREAFKKVWERYASLHEFKINVVGQEVKTSTMQAQPVITLRSLFSGEKRFRINVCAHVRGAKDLKVDELSTKVLEGWFAHELGHILDYKQYSNAEMVWYGMKYYFSAAAKRTVEYDADYIAIANGFQEEIKAMKKFILENTGIEKAYKEKIRRFYLPTEEVMVCAKDQELLKPYMNL